MSEGRLRCAPWSAQRATIVVSSKPSCASPPSTTPMFRSVKLSAARSAATKHRQRGLAGNSGRFAALTGLPDPLLVLHRQGRVVVGKVVRLWHCVEVRERVPVAPRSVIAGEGPFLRLVRIRKLATTRLVAVVQRALEAAAAAALLVHVARREDIRRRDVRHVGGQVLVRRHGEVRVVQLVVMLRRVPRNLKQ